MLYLRVAGGLRAARGLSAIKLLASAYPGEEELTLLVPVERPGLSARSERRLSLGPLWRYADTPESRAALEEYGELVAAPDGDGGARDEGPGDDEGA